MHKNKNIIFKRLLSVKGMSLLNFKDDKYFLKFKNPYFNTKLVLYEYMNHFNLYNKKVDYDLRAIQHAVSKSNIKYLEKFFFEFEVEEKLLKLCEYQVPTFNLKIHNFNHKSLKSISFEFLFNDNHIELVYDFNDNGIIDRHMFINEYYYQGESFDSEINKQIIKLEGFEEFGFFE